MPSCVACAPVDGHGAGSDVIDNQRCVLHRAAPPFTNAAGAPTTALLACITPKHTLYPRRSRRGSKLHKSARTICSCTIRHIAHLRKSIRQVRAEKKHPTHILTIVPCGVPGKRTGLTSVLTTRTLVFDPVTAQASNFGSFATLAIHGRPPSVLR